MWTVWWSLQGPVGLGCGVLFWNTTMGWKSFCLQLSVGCLLSLSCISSSSWGEGAAAPCIGWVGVWPKQQQAKHKQTNQQSSVFTKSAFVFCFVFFLFYPCLLLAGFLIFFDFIFFNVHDILFFPTCLIFIFFKQSRCLYSLRALLSEFWVPGVLIVTLSLFRAVLVWWWETLF